MDFTYKNICQHEKIREFPNFVLKLLVLNRAEVLTNGIMNGSVSSTSVSIEKSLQLIGKHA